MNIIYFKILLSTTLAIVAMWWMFRMLAIAEAKGTIDDPELGLTAVQKKAILDRDRNVRDGVIVCEMKCDAYCGQCGGTWLGYTVDEFLAEYKDGKYAKTDSNKIVNKIVNKNID